MPAARLEPDAISVAQDTFIGAALVGPSVSVALTLGALAAATAYAGPAVLALTAIPMIVIANTYRRLNLWNAKGWSVSSPCAVPGQWARPLLGPGTVRPYLKASWRTQRVSLLGEPWELSRKNIRSGTD
jgi:hypothetical protein